METDTVGDEMTGTADDGTGETLGSVDRIDLLLDEVDAALIRLDDGTYGRCVACGAVIEDAVLADQPTALRCPACAGAADVPVQNVPDPD
jgi:RNA polymerase-binding transcription factor DksA